MSSNHTTKFLRRGYSKTKMRNWLLLNCSTLRPEDIHSKYSRSLRYLGPPDSTFPVTMPSHCFTYLSLFIQFANRSIPFNYSSKLYQPHFPLLNRYLSLKEFRYRGGMRQKEVVLIICLNVITFSL